MKLEILIPDGLVEDARKLAARRKVALAKWATELIEMQIVELRVRYMLDGRDETEKKG